MANSRAWLAKNIFPSRNGSADPNRLPKLLSPAAFFLTRPTLKKMRIWRRSVHSHKNNKSSIIHHPITTIQESQSMPFGKQLILMQRVKDIATKGSSLVAIPKAANKDPPSIYKLPTVLPTIANAIFEQQDMLRGLSLRINHTARVADRLFQKGDTTMTVATMRKVMSIQQEYVHVLRVVAALKEYETYVKTGLLGTKNVSKDIEAIKSAPWNSKPPNYNDTEVLSQVAAKQFFPIMGSGGTLSYSADQSSFTSSEPTANTVVGSAA